MESHVVLTALGRDRAGILSEFSQAVLDCGCNIKDSRMSLLGNEFALIVLLSGNWNAIAKFESMLPRLEDSLQLTIHSRRTEPRSGASKLVPYAVEVVALEQPRIVHDVTEFFARRNIGIEDVYTSTYPAPHTGAPMFSLHLTVGIPGDSAIATLRGEFMDFCDDLNLDAMLAPVK